MTAPVRRHRRQLRRDPSTWSREGVVIELARPGRTRWPPCDPLAQEQLLAALAAPTRESSTHALPWSPELPTRRNALDEHRRSRPVAQVAADASDSPVPVQGPLTAATVNADIPCSSSDTSMIARRSTGSLTARAPPPSPVIDVTSPPAQKPRPAPVSTTA